MSVRMKSQAGFSLIELMIVVAIIGILATVAAPNFKRFMVQSKQGEAKQNLAAFYQAQRAFYDQWQMYPGQFAASGFKPSGTLNYRITADNNDDFEAATLPDYNFGGAGMDIADCVSTEADQADCFPNDTDAVAGTLWRESNTVVSAATCTVATAGTPSTTSTFIGCAAAQHTGAANPDEWQIDNTKRVLNAVNGLP